MAINNNQWISVKDRLPGKNGNYLCYRETPIGSFINICYYRGIGDKRYRKGFYYSDSEYGNVEISYVSHWMELPKPPKGESEK